MPFHHPFQKLCVVTLQTGQLLLIAASGSTINCISFSDGKVLYQWPSGYNVTKEISNADGSVSPHKRRRLDSNGRSAVSRQQSEASDASLEIVAERKKGERKKSKIIVDEKLPNISHLLATSDGHHLIAVTAEDKCINVFEIRSSGTLSLVSQRCPPKKLCALRLTKDEKTILAADKFGDVYAIPLHQSEGWKPKPKSEDKTEFKPAATELTVHTKGNLEALRQQLELKSRNPKKEGPDFEHQLLLGHVSLLTDLVVGEADVKGKRREFILTSDRDEHIRVSRGIPQAHIIETFCMGHQEFVTKLCIPPFRPNLLIAGNGEAGLRTFDWQSGRFLQKYRISVSEDKNLLVTERKGGNGFPLLEGHTTDKSAVSGIWTMSISDYSSPEAEKCNVVCVAVEGTSTLRAYTVSTSGDILKGPTTLQLEGNVLDVVVINSTQRILVSIDNVHKPCSMNVYREESDAPEILFQLFEVQLNNSEHAVPGLRLVESMNHPLTAAAVHKHLPVVEQQTSEEDEKAKRREKIYSSLGEFLYGLENLRKRRDATNEDDEVPMEGEAWGGDT